MSEHFPTLHRLFLAGVLALAGAMIGLPPADANAQSNVRCNGCVGARDIGTNAIKNGKIRRGAVTLSKLDNSLIDSLGGVGASLDVYEVFNSSGEKTLATSGPLRVFARCAANDNGNDRIEVVATSTANDWYIGRSRLRAGDESVLANMLNSVGVPTYNATGFIFTNFDGVIASADGSNIGFPAKSMGFGLNLFGNTCMIVGRIFTFTGRP